MIIVLKLWTKILRCDIISVVLRVYLSYEIRFINSQEVTDVNTQNTHMVNVESDSYLQVNNCSLQVRSDGFTVTRKDGWRDWQLLLVISGECIVYHNNMRYSILSGGVILYAPGEPQKYIFPNECTSLWMHFAGTSVREILDSCGVESGVYQLKPDAFITELFFTVIRRFNHEKTAKYTNASVIELLCRISDRIHHTVGIACPEGIMKAVDYINRHYIAECDRRMLADISGYSLSRFSWLFKHYMEKTPVEYQRELRLNSSRDLLCSTDLSVGQIAFFCGYDDALYFSRIFRKRYGVSPSAYRRNSERKEK